jgi:hypothetical protein
MSFTQETIDFMRANEFDYAFALYDVEDVLVRITIEDEYIVYAMTDGDETFSTDYIENAARALHHALFAQFAVAA